MLPVRENLNLLEAAQYVATHCRVSIDEARKAIHGALIDIALIPTGRQGIYARSNIENFDWRRALINWDASSAEVRGRYVHPSWDEIEISRSQIERWLRIAELRRIAERRAASPIADKNAARAGAALARRQLGAWYQDEWIPACKAEGKVPSRNEDWAAARARFGPHVTRTSVREIRQQKAPPEWHQRGRRPIK